MKVTLTVYFKEQPGQSLDDLMKLPMTVAEAFAETVERKNMNIIRGFDVACDTEHSKAEGKSNGLPYELLKQLSEKCKTR